MLSSEEQFKIFTYMVVVNSIVSDLSRRIKAYFEVKNVRLSAQSSDSLEKAVNVHAKDVQNFRTVAEELGEVESFGENPCC